VVAYKQAKGKIEGGAQRLVLGVAAGGVSINPSSAFGQAGFMKSGGGSSGAGKPAAGSGAGSKPGSTSGAGDAVAPPPSIKPAVSDGRWWANSAP
jgi:hypothetical protein